MTTTSPRTKKSRPAFPYFGGKSSHADKIIPYLSPQFKTYIEVFGGSAGLLLAKPPHPVEVYNDIYEPLVSFFRILRSPVLFPEFYRRVKLYPYSRAEYRHCLATWQDQPSLMERTVRWYIVARWSFSGRFGASWSFARTESQRGMPIHVASWQSILVELPEIARRFQRVQVEQDSWDVIIPRYDDPTALFYLDPPYIHDTRKGGEYAQEMESADHERLVTQLLTVKGGVVLSGYDHPLYEPLVDSKWRVVRWSAPSSAVGRTRAIRMTQNTRRTDATAFIARTEVLWINPQAQRYLPQLQWNF